MQKPCLCETYENAGGVDSLLWKKIDDDQVNKYSRAHKNETKKIKNNFLKKHKNIFFLAANSSTYYEVAARLIIQIHSSGCLISKKKLKLFSHSSVY